MSNLMKLYSNALIAKEFFSVVQMLQIGVSSLFLFIARPSAISAETFWQEFPQ